MMRQRLPKFVNTVTYSTCLYSKQLQEAGFTTANNCMILTCWQQIDGQKTNRIVHASVKDHYEAKARTYSSIKEHERYFGDNCVYYNYPYDCHDLKILLYYLLLGIGNKKC